VFDPPSSFFPCWFFLVRSYFLAIRLGCCTALVPLVFLGGGFCPGSPPFLGQTERGRVWSNLLCCPCEPFLQPLEFFSHFPPLQPLASFCIFLCVSYGVFFEPSKVFTPLCFFFFVWNSRGALLSLAEDASPQRCSKVISLVVYRCSPAPPHFAPSLGV